MFTAKNYQKKTEIFKQKRIDGLERKESRNKYRSNHVLVIRTRTTLQSTKHADYGKLQVSPGEKENKRQITRKSERKAKNTDS